MEFGVVLQTNPPAKRVIETMQRAEEMGFGYGWTWDSHVLWQGLRTNDLSVVSTDHCPFCFKDQKELGRGDFSKIPNGMPGVELTGRVATTLSRGRVVIDDGTYQGSPGHGAFLARGANQYLL